MNPKRLFYVLVASIVLLAGVASAMTYFGYKIMSKTSDQLVQAKLDSLTADVRLQQYLKAKKYVTSNKDIRDIVNQMIPNDKYQDVATSELYKIAEQSGISIDKIQYPSSTLGVKPAATTSPGSSSGNTNNNPAPATPSTPVPTQAKAVDGISGIYGVDVDVSLISSNKKDKEIPYESAVKFLQLVELNRRSMQVKKVLVQPGKDFTNIKFDVTITIFIKP